MTNESSANAIIGNTLRIIASGEYHPGAELTQKMASYIIELEQKLTDMAVQIANAESKCRELAAECKTLSRFISGSCYVFDGDHDDDMPDEFIDASHYMPIVTPATDAFLAEVLAHGVKSLSNAVQSVISERQRQQSVEGWTPKHDDKHDNNELAFAASCYAFHSAAASWDFEDDGTPYDIHPAPKNWPWSPEWWKPKNPRRDLVKAGALILAEIERLDRAAAGKGE